MCIRDRYKNEKIINNMQKILTGYLVQINNHSLNEEQHLLVKNLFYSINDLERMGDHCENLAELADEKRKSGIVFSSEASQEMDNMIRSVEEAVDSAVSARKDHDMTLVCLLYTSRCPDDQEDQGRPEAGGFFGDAPGPTGMWDMRGQEPAFFQ